MAEELEIPLTEEAQKIALFRDKIAEMVGSVGSTLVAPSLNAQLPMIGQGLADLADLQANLTAPLTDIFDAVEATLAELQAAWDAALVEVPFEQSVAEALEAIEGLKTIVGDDNTLQLSVEISESVTESVALAENLGLGEATLLDIEGSAEVGLQFDAALGLTLSLDEAKVVLDTSEEPIATLCLTAEAALDSEADLGLVGLAFDAETQAGGLNLKFDLMNTETGLDVDLRDDVEAGLTGEFTTTFAGNFLPSISATLDLDFGTIDGDLDFDNLFEFPDLNLTGISIDGGALAEFLRVHFGQILDVFDTFPLGQIIDFLTTPVPIISELPFGIPNLDGIDGVTVGDLVIWGTGADIDLSFIGWADALIDFGLKVTGEFEMPDADFSFGDISFDGVDVGNLLGGDLSFGNFLDIGLDGLDLSVLTGEGLWGDLGGWQFDTGELENPADYFSFPVFDAPMATAMSLLFSGIGGNVDPVDLFSIQMPELDFGMEALNIGAPFGPFTIGLTGNFDVTAEFSIGYDSAGLFGDGSFAEGFYIEAGLPPSAGVTYPVAELGFFLGAYGSVNLGLAEAGLRGGIEGTVALGFAEENDGIKRLADLFPCVFDEMGGRLAAVVDAFARIGVGPFSYTVRQNLFDVTIAQFNGDPCSGAGSSGGREVTGSGLAEINKDTGALHLNVGEERGDRSLEEGIDVDYEGRNPAQHESFRISLSRDDEGNVIENEVIVAAFGVYERYSTVGLTKITGDFHKGEDVLIVDNDVALALDIDAGSGGSSIKDLDVVVGGSLNDSIKGGIAEDVLRGMAGVDSLYGGDGDDILDGGTSGDLMHGGNGTDQVDYSASNAAVTITPFDFADLDSLDAAQKALLNGLSPARAMIGSGGDAEGDVLYAIERLIGSRFSDTLTGDPNAANQIDGGDGDDTIVGGKGDDLLVGGRGADELHGGNGDDWTSFVFSLSAVGVDFQTGLGYGGEASGDTYDSIENAVLSGYGDVFYGDAGSNEVQGLSGADYLDGGGGADVVDGGLGDDTVVGYGQGATLSGGNTAERWDGTDLLTYQFAAPIGAAEDTFATKIDLLNGLAQIGLVGFDTLDMAVRFDSDGKEEAVEGVNTFDDVMGTGQADWIIGDQTSNHIDGSDGDDLIEARGGFDTLVGGAGADTLLGGTGIDWVDYHAATGAVTVDLGSQTGAGAEAQDDVYLGIENVLGSAFTDVIKGDDERNLLDPGLYGAIGTEAVSGGDGTDGLRLVYEDAADADGGFDILLRSDFTGEAETIGGRTVVDFDGIEFLQLVLGAGADQVVTKLHTDDLISTGEGDDTVQAGFGADGIYLGGGDDILGRGKGLTDVGPSDEGHQAFYLDGGAGFDTAELDLTHASNNITIDLSTDAGVAAFQRGIVAGAGYITNFEMVSNIATGEGDDYLSLTGDLDRSIFLGKGDNVLKVTDGDTQITAEAGNDTITATGSGATDIDSGAGDDLITIDTGVNSVAGGLGWDVLIADYSDEVAVVLEQEKGGTPGEGAMSVVGGLQVITTISATGFSGIEQFIVTGGAQGDELQGSDFDTGPGDVLDGADGNDNIIGQSGDDSLIGGLGRDSLFGDAGNDTLKGGVHGAEGGELKIGGIYANGDLLYGGLGSDLIILGDETGTYYGVGDEFTNDYARVQLDDDDTIQLAGTAADYLYPEPFGDDPPIIYLASTQERVAIIELADGAAAFEGLDDPRLSFVPVEPGVVMGQILADVEIGIGDGVVLAATGEDEKNPDGTDSHIPCDGEHPIQELHRSAAHDVVQNLQIGDIKNATYSGSDAAFGCFEADLDFHGGARSGFVLSTGRVEDILGANTDMGQIVSSGLNETVQLSFEALNDGVAVATLPSLAEGLRSLTLVDDNDRKGGGTGSFSGLDLDAIFLSTTRLTVDDFNDAGDLNDDGLLPKLDLFQFHPGAMRYTPGDMRDGGPDQVEFKGVVNGMVQTQDATLDVVDYPNGPSSGVLTLGDGGILELELSEALDTSGQPIYLYTVEGGDTEALLADIRASDEGIQPQGDLSTDLGLAGIDGDRASLRADFFVEEASDGAIDLFDVVILTEELPEFGGADLTDTVSVKINGVETLLLSDGRAATMDNLALTPLGSFHPDLAFNLPGSGELSDFMKADAYTRVLTISAPVQAGDNTLEITVADGRDGLLDTAIVVLPRSEIGVISGTDGDDTLDGTQGDDDVRGGFGDDVFTVGLGQDRFDGGAGQDLAITEYTLDALQVALQGDTVIVTDANDKTELRNVERLQVGTGPDAVEIDLTAALQDDNFVPILQDDAGLVKQGNATLVDLIDLRANDLDLDGDPLTITQISNTTHFRVVDGAQQIAGQYGALSLSAAGIASYTLDAEHIGTQTALEDLFRYTVSDGKDSARADIRIEIQAAPDTTPPLITLDDLETSDTSPALTGTIDDPLASIKVDINGKSYVATNNGDGTWKLPQGEIEPLPLGEVEITLIATDPLNNVAEVTDKTSVEIIIPPDVTPPVVTIDPIETANPSPKLTGTLDDPTAFVEVEIEGFKYPAFTEADGTWVLTEGYIPFLDAGTYAIKVYATDPAGNVGTVSDADGLVILPPEPLDLALTTEQVLNMHEVQELEMLARFAADPEFYSSIYIASLSLFLSNLQEVNLSVDGTGLDNIILGGAGADAPGTGTLLDHATGNLLDHSEIADLIMGLDAADTLLGEGGNDLLDGGSDADVLEGGADNDTLLGGAGEDTLTGGEGNDLLVGGGDADILSDGAGDDSVSGGQGDDLFLAGTGSDTFDGGDGQDLILIDTSGFTPGDFIVEVNFATGEIGAKGSEVNRDSVSGIEQLQLDGGLAAEVTGDAEANSLLTGSGADTVNGGGGNDTIIGYGGADALSGGDQDDFIDGKNGNDYLFGGKDNDLLIGWGGRDRLRGNNGDDTMVGGNKNDFLQGGAGADVFVFNTDNGFWAKDFIKDFELGVDRVVVEGFTEEDVSWKALKSGLGVMAIVDGGGKIVFNGHDQADLDSFSDWDFLA